MMTLISLRSELIFKVSLGARGKSPLPPSKSYSVDIDWQINDLVDRRGVYRRM